MNLFSVEFELSGGFGYYDGERCDPFLAALERLEAEEIMETFVFDSQVMPPDLKGDGAWHVSGMIRAEDYAAACRKVADEQDEHWMEPDDIDCPVLFLVRIMHCQP